MDRAQIEYGRTILRGYRKSPFQKWPYFLPKSPFSSYLVSKFSWPAETRRFFGPRFHF